MASTFDSQAFWRTHIYYPQNLYSSYSYTPLSKLATYKKRLDEEEKSGLLLSSEDAIDGQFEVPIRDLDTISGKGATHADPGRQLTNISSD